MKQVLSDGLKREKVDPKQLRRQRGKRPATQQRLDAAIAVLAIDHPMTVRQVYYQLVARQVIENKRSSYQAVSTLLVEARRNGTIPWAWIEDRLRRPREVVMWQNVPTFAREMKHWYRRDVWATQPRYVEVWLEKDALSGIFEDVLAPYGVTLNVGRGYDGWDSIYNAAKRYEGWPDVTVLYFGDFDPSGEDMVRSLRERLASLYCDPELIKCALTLEDVRRYHLPPDVTKGSDSRQAGFVAKYGDIAVELDALPASVLRTRLTTEVEARLDLDALNAVRELEAAEQARLVQVVDDIDAVSEPPAGRVSRRQVAPRPPPTDDLLEL